VLLGSVAERTVRLAACPVLTVGPASRRTATGADEKIAAKEIDRILVPVDFSEDAQRALDEAIEFAVAFGAELDLLHSYPINPQAIAPYGIVAPEEFERDLRIAARQRLSEWREKVSAAGCKGQDQLSADLPSEAILEAAQKRDVDLIVMGTRGITGLAHVLLGSVAERTIRTAPCPVLTVKKSGAHGCPT
jgi:nucleotide-binding universal stress UspA family protein